MGAEDCTSEFHANPRFFWNRGILGHRRTKSQLRDHDEADERARVAESALACLV